MLTIEINLFCVRKLSANIAQQYLKSLACDKKPIVRKQTLHMNKVRVCYNSHADSVLRERELFFFLALLQSQPFCLQIMCLRRS